MSIEIKQISEIPAEIMAEIVKVQTEDYTQDEINEFLEDFDFECFQEIIRDCGDYEKTTDFDYINYEYSYTLPSGKYKLRTYGSKYLKDRCICDLEMDESVYIVDVELENESKKKAKDAKKVKQDEDWTNLFEGKTKEELLEILKGYKFPITKK